MESQTTFSTIQPTLTYATVRQEILDQKKCQFQLFATTLTLNAAILAYGGTTGTPPVVYIAPILMNVLALTIILDKAISIQRMVGYLQLMESEPNSTIWRWEYHLSRFRTLAGESQGTDSHRRHAYIRNIALILTLLNLVAGGLYWFGPSAIQLKGSESYGEVREVYGAINFCVVTVVGLGLVIAVRRWLQLVFGKFTTKATRVRWQKAIRECEDEIVQTLQVVSK